VDNERNGAPSADSVDKPSQPLAVGGRLALRV